MLLAERAETSGCARSSRNCSVIASDAGPRACRRINSCSRSRKPSRSRRRGRPRPRAPAERKARAAKRGANRGALPAHLPRIETVVDVEDKTCPAARASLHRIGEDVSERLDIVPAQFRVLVVRRPKYACRTCEDVVVQAPAPSRLIEGGLPTEATVAQVLVSKYADHLPALPPSPDLCPAGRQSGSLDARRLGRARRLPAAAGARAIARPTKGLVEALRRRDDGAGARSRTGPDQDRSALGLCPGRPTLGRQRSARRRLCLRARPQSRAADRPSRRLPRRSSGRRLCRLQGAGRAAARCNSPSAGAMSAAASTSSPQSGPAPIASEALDASPLSTDRGDIRGRSAEERRAVRQERSRPLVEALEPWLREKLSLISQKTKLAEAIRYALSRWAGLRASSKMAGSKSTTTPSSAPSARSRSTAKMPSSPAPMAGPSTGR